MSEQTDVREEEQKQQNEEVKEPKEEKANDKDAPKYTDADVDRIVQEKKARWQKESEAKINAEKEKLSEAQKLESMNEIEKARYNAEKLQAEIDELKREKNLNEQTKIARKELTSAGITISDELLSVFVSPDAEITKSAIDSLKVLWPQAVNAAVEEQLKRKLPQSEAASQNTKSAGVLYAEKYNKERVPQNKG